MLGGLITIAGGTLAASGLIVARLPNAREVIDKLTPYMGWIGIVMFGWGVKEVIFSLMALDWLTTFPMRWTFWMLCGIADIIVGFLLGFGLITKYALSKNPAAEQRGQQIRAKLVNYQGPLGLFAIVMGVLYIVM